MTLYSLQVFDNPPFGDPSGLGRLFPSVTDLAPDLVTWSQTAAALAQMDLVITIDCSVANLVGAMGLPVWIYLRRRQSGAGHRSPPASPE